MDVERRRPERGPEDADESGDRDAHEEHCDDQFEEREPLFVARRSHGWCAARPGRSHAQRLRPEAYDPASLASHDGPVLVGAELFDELRHDPRRWVLASKFENLDLGVRVVFSLLLEPVVQQLALGW